MPIQYTKSNDYLQKRCTTDCYLLTDQIIDSSLIHMGNSYYHLLPFIKKTVDWPTVRFFLRRLNL